MEEFLPRKHREEVKEKLGNPDYISGNNPDSQFWRYNDESKLCYDEVSKVVFTLTVSFEAGRVKKWKFVR